MSIASQVKSAVARMYRAYENAFVPDRTDLLGSLVLSIPMYLLFGLSLIFLLPLIILGVVFIFFLRRTWKLIIVYLTYKILRRKIKGI